MNSNNLKPEKVTKPIQLLAAWLLGLVLINSSFLLAAGNIQSPSWGSGALIIATIVNVPVFLISLFVLQTKFRPEMQEDTYYSEYLQRKYTGNSKVENKTIEIDTDKYVKEILSKINEVQKPQDKEKEIEEIIKKRDFENIKAQVSDSRSLSELYLYPKGWKEIIESWGDNEDFKADLEQILRNNLVTGSINNISEVKLNAEGKKIAKELANENLLWNQVKNKRHMKNKKH
jgi:exoribonuclease R